MTWLLGWQLPDGTGGYSQVSASGFAEAVRVLRFQLLPEYARSLRIVQAGVL